MKKQPSGGIVRPLDCRARPKEVFASNTYKWALLTLLAIHTYLGIMGKTQWGLRLG